MNKKANSSRDFLIFLVVAMIVVFLSLVLAIAHFIQIDQACEDIGFESHRITGEIDACEDAEGNIHFVKIKGDIFNGYKATPIKVGEVWGTGK